MGSDSSSISLSRKNGATHHCVRIQISWTVSENNPEEILHYKFKPSPKAWLVHYALILLDYVSAFGVIRFPLSREGMKN